MAGLLFRFLFFLILKWAPDISPHLCSLSTLWLKVLQKKQALIILCEVLTLSYDFLILLFTQGT